MSVLFFKHPVFSDIFWYKVYIIYKGRALSFAFRKLALNMTHNAYSNKSPYKYYISILEGGGWFKAMLILHI